MNANVTGFEFTSYSFEPAQKRVVFHYQTTFADREPILWTETITLPEIPAHAVPQKFLEGLHIMLGISYWKFYCATNISLPYSLSKGEAEFFTTVYKKGLGEFFYQNKLDPSISPRFQTTNSKSQIISNFKFQISNSTKRSLVGIGGGKDSIVSAELLKAQNFDITSFNIETGKSSKIVDNVIKTICAPSLKLQRALDPKVHQPHSYNGHIPISAIYAFLGIFSCVLYGYDYFIVSNEHSSNFGNIKYRGLEINHQWSKSFEFETLFGDYLCNLALPPVRYFSLLRSLYEIRIVKQFAKYPQYFPLFSSCNKNFSAGGNGNGKLWCGACAKCAFAFILLSAFLPKKQLLDIFGKNLYRDETLLPLFKDVLGFGTMKPFDCVGTFAESQTALFLAKKKFAKDFIVRQFGARAKYHPEVFQTNKNTCVPPQYLFAVAQSAYILGYGKEGKITKQFLKKQYPKLTVRVGDGALDKNYLANQAAFDIAIKTPGINKNLVTIPCTTATNIFFSRVLGHNTIIGVTGSKGKSTTSSLIYHILKTAGKDVQLLGNIGKPMLESLLAPIPAGRIFVLELSSYQLDDIKFSPNIAVVTNLFPEHLDFHGNLKNYYAAKKNIINFQTADNFFVYQEKTAGWLKDYPGQAVPFSRKPFESNLLGEHNQSNIGAAVAVAQIMGVDHQQIQEAVKSFKGLEHRLELVGTFKGITFYDDAISTTPESTIMAIKALPQIGTIFLGGQDRGYHFSQLEKVIKQHNIKNIVLFPDSGRKIIKNKKGLNILNAKTMAEAVKFAYQHTPTGTICLLSCASPSYSLWKNFEHKGDQFKTMVKKYASAR